jgi:hypothetical protein
LYPEGETQHPGGDVNYLLVCRVALGFVLRTKWGCSHRLATAKTKECGCGKKDLHSKGQGLAMDDGATVDGTVFVMKPCRELQHLPKTQPPIRHHSLLAEKGGSVKRYREFVIFHGEQIYP